MNFPMSPVAVLYGADGKPVLLDERYGPDAKALVTSTRFEPGPSLDAFGRLRTAEQYTIFDSKQLIDGGPLFFSNVTASGGSVTYQPLRSSSLLSTNTTDGSRALRQTKRYFNYQPGKSQLIKVTFIPTNGGETNVDKMVGYFDDDNGVFFRLRGASPQMVIRSDVSGSVVENVIEQADWNIDPLNGTGRSGLTLDVSKAHILFIDLQWLGVGTVRVGFEINKRLYYVHEFDHANIADSVYMRTPNLPVRWEVLNTDVAVGTPSLEAICCSVSSEGGFDPVGLTRSVDTGAVAGRQTNEVPIALLAVRLQASKVRAPVFPRAFSLMSSTNSNARWALVLNPTLGGPDTWVQLPNSALEYSITKTTASDGTVLDAGFMSGNTEQVNGLLGSVLTLAADYAGTPDVLALVVNNMAGSNETYYGSLTFTELV